MGSNSDSAYEDYAQEEHARQQRKQAKCNHEYIPVYNKHMSRTFECRLCGKKVKQ